MRIIGGARRGLHLADVGAGDPAAHLRPTSDRVREAMFNLIQNGKAAAKSDPVRGKRVLDLFAGTGALGLEALSRGASDVTFVDDGKVALALLKANIEKMQAQETTEVLRRDATKPATNTGAAFDLIFLDPPYGKGLGELALAAAQIGGWIAAKALIVWEEGSEPTLPAGFTLIDQRRYGETVVTLLRAAA
ncbi:16S rRNA (guanine(966)-N(2))-methyltransferase RsmD [Neogemmobacter tilapiae]|uniref:Methyltransferase n=1 Tax=Neogemmobacter tilapiae TaxID=875041 RepID=A0A918TMC0_9RHOB|nr:16S rRNA (guanine(966)-N(2))-methyltransferase RsmD [Gemmobacter tilapiae]GHC55575.1 methyltransferase [Gemmobacter tilapiae]